jgi:tRNA-dihydrouridine synthase
VIGNGDVRSPADAQRMIDRTGCAGVMIGRAAIAHPWIVGGCRALLDRGEEPSPVWWRERIALCREHMAGNVEERGEHRAVRYMRRYYPGYLKGLPGAANLRSRLNAADTLAAVLDLYGEYERYLEDRERGVESASFAAA